MVGRELVQILYRYRITIDRLNKVLLTEGRDGFTIQTEDVFLEDSNLAKKDQPVSPQNGIQWSSNKEEPSPESGTSTPANTEKMVSSKASARGPYQTAQLKKDQVISYYQTEIRDAIASDLRRNKEPDAKQINDAIWKRLINKGHNDRTLRGYLSASKREELFGEIHRQVLEMNALTAR